MITLTKEKENEIRELITRGEVFDQFLPPVNRNFNKDHLRLVGNFFYHVGDYKKAIQYYAKILVREPTDEITLYNMRIAMEKLK